MQPAFRVRTTGVSKPTLLLIGHGASRTGAPVSLLNILRWMRANTPDEFVVVLGNGGPLVSDYERLATVHLWNTGGAPRSSLPARALRRLLGLWGEHAKLEAHQQRIMQTLRQQPVRCVFNNTGVNGHILAALKPCLGVPVVSRIPELEGHMRKNNRTGSVDRVLALTDHYVAASAAVMNNLVSRHSIREDRVSVVYGASAAARGVRGSAGLRDRLGLPADAFVVGGCGTLEYHKGIDLFIQLAHHCVNQLGRRDVHFCWIGARVSQDSWIDYCCEIEQLGLKRHLFLTGEIEDTAAAFADLDMFALTSREDAFPLVMIEAARQGLPVVCFQGSGGAEEFVDAEIGAVVPMLDIPAFATVLLAARDSPARRTSMGEAAYLRSLQYTPDNMARAINRVIEDVSARPAQS